MTNLTEVYIKLAKVIPYASGLQITGSHYTGSSIMVYMVDNATNQLCTVEIKAVQEPDPEELKAVAEADKAAVEFEKNNPKETLQEGKYGFYWN